MHCSITDWALLITRGCSVSSRKTGSRIGRRFWVGCIVDFWILVSNLPSQNRSSRDRVGEKVMEGDQIATLGPRSCSRTSNFLRSPHGDICEGLHSADFLVLLKAVEPLHLRESNEFPWQNTLLAAALINVSLTLTRLHNTQLLTFYRARRSHNGSVLLRRRLDHDGCLEGTSSS